jgi:hypothetical protein
MDSSVHGGAVGIKERRDAWMARANMSNSLHDNTSVVLYGPIKGAPTLKESFKAFNAIYLGGIASIVFGIPGKVGRGIKSVFSRSHRGEVGDASRVDAFDVVHEANRILRDTIGPTDLIEPAVRPTRSSNTVRRNPKDVSPPNSPTQPDPLGSNNSDIGPRFGRGSRGH